MGRLLPALSSLLLPLGCGRGPHTLDPDPGRQPSHPRRAPTWGHLLLLGRGGAGRGGASGPTTPTARRAGAPPRHAHRPAAQARRPAPPRHAPPRPKLQTRELPGEDRPPGQTGNRAPGQERGGSRSLPAQHRAERGAPPESERLRGAEGPKDGAYTGKAGTRG